MNTIANMVFDEERALYALRDTLVTNCRFDGPADGESPLKECADVAVEECWFNLRYALWHDRNLKLSRSELTPMCRAALWYCDNVDIRDCRLHGIKALRECGNIRLADCEIRSPEFGWFTRDVSMEGCDVEGEYFMMRSDRLYFRNVHLNGKYSFQYITDSVFENCVLNTKDAFWHGKNITVRNCTVTGEYLAWYSENITFDHCKIVGTQPLCYCKGLKLIDCEMVDTDLSFERSEVEATLTAPIVSIKNPLSGSIRVPAVGEVIRDTEGAQGEVIIG